MTQRIQSQGHPQRSRKQACRQTRAGCVHCSSIHHIQEVETTQVSVDERRGKHSVVPLCDATVGGQESTGGPDPRYNTDGFENITQGAKDHRVYDSAYMKRPEPANNRDRKQPGAEQGEE